MQLNYATRVDVLLQRVRQLRRGVSEIHTNSVENLVAAGRNDVAQSLLDFVRELNTLETHVKPQVVGLAGNVSAGKSTFINQILNTTVVSTGTGSTTAVPTEISFIPGNEYRATVHFVSIEEIKKDLRDLSCEIPPLGQAPNESFSGTALVSKLARFFDFVGPPLAPPHPSTDEDLRLLTDGQLFGLIGAVPRVFHAPEMPDLLNQIGRYIRFDTSLGGVDALLPHAVNRVCIEGPFADIPSGVVLVDTPGINDGARVNSQRANNSIPGFDELWFLTDSSILLANETDQAFLSRALITEGIPVQIASTRIDGTDGDTEEALRTKIRSNLRCVFFAHLRGISLHAAKDVTISTPEEEEELASLVAQITINFTGVPPARYNAPTTGFEYWRERLVQFGVERAANLQALELSLRALEQEIAAFGLVRPGFMVPVNDFQGWQQNAHNALNQHYNQVSGVDIRTFYNDVYKRGKWGAKLYWNQYEAIMSPAYSRRGRFDSPTALGLVDVNADIANQWINSTRLILHHIRLMQQSLAAHLQQILNGWVGAPPGAINMLQIELRILDDSFKALIYNGFLGNTAERVQGHFFYCGTYRYNRRTYPLFDEVLSAMQNVCGSAVIAGLNAIRDVVDNIVRRFLALANPVIDLPPLIRGALDALLADPNVPPPAVRGGGVEEPLQQNDGDWWVLSWRECCEEYRARLAAEAAVHDLPVPVVEEEPV